MSTVPPFSYGITRMSRETVLFIRYISAIIGCQAEQEKSEHSSIKRGVVGKKENIFTTSELKSECFLDIMYLLFVNKGEF